MSRPLRVFNVIGGLGVGGVQRRLVELLRVLDPEVVRFDFVVFEGPPGDLEAEATALGATIHRCPTGLRFPVALGRLLRAEQPDVVHSHMHYASGIVMAVADRAGVPVRITHFRNSHDGRAPSLRKTAQSALMCRWVDAHATDILAVSRGALEGAWTDRRAADARCQVIYNGIDFAALAVPTAGRAEVRRELGVPEDAFLAVNVGRFSPAKNHLRLLEVFRAVLDRRPGAFLVLVGDGPDELVGTVRDRIAALGMDDAVRFAGRRDDVADVLHAADVMVFTSLWEGLPGVVLEAVGTRLPVVASALPGVLEISEQVPGQVRVLSLDETDERWADAVIDEGTRRPAAAREGPTMPTAFSMAQNVEELLAVWSGAGGSGTDRRGSPG